MHRKLMMFVLAGLLLGFGGAAIAQVVTGTISGTVKDSSGAVVPNATVTLMNTDQNQVVRTVKSDANGEYSAPLLPLGSYSVSAAANQFKTAIVTGVQLHVNDQLTINLTLEVGATSQTVTVEAAPVQVELQSAAPTGLISGTQIRELALNTRNYEQLVSLMPGVSYGAGDQLYIGLANPSGQTNVVSFSINGQRNSANSWTIDGADNVDRGSNLTLLDYPSVDSIAEFRVERGLYAADSGRAGAGQINVITKSGTNQFHGDAYEFFRSDKLAANTFFNNANGKARPPLRYNDFGYTIGGPAYIPHVFEQSKSNTFFFFSQEFRRVITYGTAAAIVPTAAELAGTFPDKVCIHFDNTGKCDTVSNQVPAINSTAQQYIKDVWSKTPQATDPVTNQIFNPLRNIFNGRQEILRLDHTFGTKVSGFFRYINDSIPTEEPGGLFTNQFIPGVSTTSTNAPGHSYLFHATYAVTPNVLNEAGYSYSYGAIASNPIGLTSRANSPDVNVPLPFQVTLSRIPNVAIQGGTSISSFGPYRDFNRDHNIYDNFTWIHGKHTMKYGISYQHYQKTENAGGGNEGTFNFNNTGASQVQGLCPTCPVPTTFEQSFANFLTGNVGNFTQSSIDITPDIRDNQLEWYAQDQFKVRSNLTFNFGARLSYFRQPTDASGRLDNFSPLTFLPGQALTVVPFDPTQPSNSTQNKLAGLLCPGNPGAPICAQTGNPLDGIIVGGSSSPYGSKVSNEDSFDIAPRLGIAWDPFGTGITSVRAGYGIYYDSSLFGTYEQNTFANPPFVQSISIPNTQFSNPGAGTPSVNLNPLALHATPLPYHTPYVQDWSLDVQRMLPKSVLLDVGYYGEKGTHLLGIIDVNEVHPGLAASLGYPGITSANTPILNSIRPFRGYNAINTLATRFDSNYHSLQIAVQKRFGASSLLDLNYTFSHALTDAQTDRSSAPQNTYDLRAEYGPSQLDRTHVFTADYVYDLPFFKAQEGIVGHVLGGWEASGIVSYFSGLPLTVTTFSNLDPAGLGFFGPSAAGPRPNMVANPNSGAPHTFAQWFNTLAFVDPTTSQTTPGNAPRGAVRGPGAERWDFSAIKNIKLTESMKLQFRGEFFNIFNHTNPDGIRTSFGSGTFGRVISTRDPRIIQLGLKFYY